MSVFKLRETDAVLLPLLFRRIRSRRWRGRSILLRRRRKAGEIGDPQEQIGEGDAERSLGLERVAARQLLDQPDPLACRCEAVGRTLPGGPERLGHQRVGQPLASALEVVGCHQLGGGVAVELLQADVELDVLHLLCALFGQPLQRLGHVEGKAVERLQVGGGLLIAAHEPQHLGGGSARVVQLLERGAQRGRRAGVVDRNGLRRALDLLPLAAGANGQETKDVLLRHVLLLSIASTRSGASRCRPP